MLGVVIDADLLARERLVHAVAEELAQVADVDGSIGRLGLLGTHGLLSTLATEPLAAGCRAC